MSEQYQVRIKPYNRKRGYKVRCIFHRGKRYLETAGWYSPLDKWLADELAEVTQPDDDEKFVFDVVTLAEAKRIEDREEAEAKQGQARHAVPFDSSSVRGAPQAPAAPPPSASETSSMAGIADEPGPTPEDHSEYESDEEDRPKPKPKDEPKKAATAKKEPKARRGAKAQK